MTCPICNGSGERDGEYGLLSCDAPNCTAATERAALEAANKAAEPMTVYDQRWFAYGLGKPKWHALSMRRPEKDEVVLVTSENWTQPMVLIYQDYPFERMLNSYEGKWYWYPERMHWMSLPDNP